ncbi:MAG: class I SAM-dependent methyltransferase [Candidatus Caldarchaeum sp.]|nr:class I SAM-dependent methyltransferase [Candidatus Caldarchaeum sp.]MDW8434615.1 class I SAM-dependent methyltransferase [Candidatus Caldarchaeum sp.]
MAIGYDFFCDGYDELYGEEQSGKYRRCFELVSGRFERLCDVGCGTGLFKMFLRDAGVGCDYVGVDVSAGMLRKARERCDESTHLLQADAHHLPFRDKVFSHVFAFTVVHHLNPDRFITEAERVCTELVVVSQHKRLSPRIQQGVRELGSVDEFVFIDCSTVFRQASGGGC